MQISIFRVLLEVEASAPPLETVEIIDMFFSFLHSIVLKTKNILIMQALNLSLSIARICAIKASES